MITNAKDNEYVDHINHNTLDNRKENLRLCSNSQNLQNRGKLPSINTSGFIGVYWIKDKSKWRSEIQYNNTKIHLGYYNNIKEAVLARIDAEKKYFGEYKSDINKNKLESET